MKGTMNPVDSEFHVDPFKCFTNFFPIYFHALYYNYCTQDIIQQFLSFKLNGRLDLLEVFCGYNYVIEFIQ